MALIIVVKRIQVLLNAIQLAMMKNFIEQHIQKHDILHVLLVLPADTHFLISKDKITIKSVCN